MAITIDSKHSRASQLLVEVTFAPKSLRLTPTLFGVLIALDDCTLSGDPGGPALPMKTLRVALPPGTKASGLSFEAVESVTVGDGPMLPAPMQPSRPGAQRGGDHGHPPCSHDGQDRNLSAERVLEIVERLREAKVAESLAPPAFERAKPELYARSVEAPRPLARIETVEVRGANPVVVVHVSPLRIDQNGRLELVTRVALSIDYVLDAPTASPKSDGAPPEQRRLASRAQAIREAELTRSLVVNPEWVIDFGAWFTPVPSHVDYLIITDNYTWDAASISRGSALSGDMVAELERLAAWKRRRGLSTHVATLTRIVAGRYGDFRTGARDLQEVVRNFLKHAHAQWGVAWVVLGGDIGVVPVRQVVGYAAGNLGTTSSDPPPDSQLFWTGSFGKLRSSGNSASSVLLNAANGLLVPYDAVGSSSSAHRGWFFTTDESYATRSTTSTTFIRVNGPAAEVNGALQWVVDDNLIPTDFYYASLSGPSYGQPGRHDWDLPGAGVYGAHTDGADAGGVEYETDVSVGRVPVASAAQARAFVDKLIAYESFRRPDGARLSADWTRKMLIGAANWGGRIAVWPGGANPPGEYQAFHSPAGHALLNTKDPLTIQDWRLLVQVSEADLRLSPYDRAASTTRRGWHFARSATDLSPSEISIPLFGSLFHFPIATQWVVLYGAPEELAPQAYVFDYTLADGSLSDQEQLRRQVVSDFPAINNFVRLYEDDIDLTPAERAAAPVEHLTEAGMLTRLNETQHFVSLSGHGWWGGCCGYGINASENAANGYHSYIAYADSCSTNRFDVDDAVSERSLYNEHGGAVAYLGNSRFSWIGVGDNYQRAFFKRLQTTRHLGLAADSRCALLATGTGFWRRYDKWAIFALNLMGDPEMPVWVGPPLQLRAQFKTDLDSRLPFEVVITSRSALGLYLPVSGAVVTLTQGSLYRQVTTDLAGRVSIDIRDATLGPLELTITKLGYEPFVGAPEVTGPLWVRGSVLVIAHQHPTPDKTFVDLELSAPIAGDTRRGWCARRSLPDYSVILDAITDAHVTSQPIALFVDSIRHGGTIEKFRFGEFERLFALDSEAFLAPLDVSTRLSITIERPAGLQAPLENAEATVSPPPQSQPQNGHNTSDVMAPSTRAQSAVH